MSKLTKSDYYYMSKHGVRVFYSDRARVRDWRAPNDAAFFCGWYWQRGNQRQGAFMTPSAAARHAIDHLKGELPVPTQEEVTNGMSSRKPRRWAELKGQTWFEAYRTQKRADRARAGRVLRRVA